MKKEKWKSEDRHQKQSNGERERERDGHETQICLV